MPAVGGGRTGKAVRIDLDRAIPWVLNRREPAGSQRERLAKAQADKFELDNAVKRGELLLANHVAEVLATLGADLASRHDAVPGRCAGEFAGINDPAQIRTRLLEELRNVRGAFAVAADKLAYSGAAAEDDGGDSEAADGADAESVGGHDPGAPARKRRTGTVAQ